MSERKYDSRHAGGGDLGNLPEQPDTLAPCPSCGATLSVGEMVNPNTGRLASILLHEMPFCDYYGATAPEQILRDLLRGTIVQ